MSNSSLEGLGQNARRAITQGIFVIYGVIVVFPMVWLGYTAFKSTSELFASAWALPIEWKLDNFVEAWNEAQIGDFFWNSIFVTISTLLLQLFLGAMASYSLAKYRFPGQNLLYYGFLAGLMFPIFLGLVPLFFLVKHLGLLDTHLGIILVYAAFGIPSPSSFSPPSSARARRRLWKPASWTAAGTSRCSCGSCCPWPSRG